MAIDIKQWLREEMGFTAEQAETLAPQFADKAPKLESGYVGPAERTRLASREAEITTLQEQHRQANERLTAEMAEWASLSSKEKAQATELQASLETARVRATQLETRLTSVATQYGIDPKTLLDGTTPLPAKVEAPVVPAVDARYLRPEQVAPIFDYQLELGASLIHIQNLHKELTGETLDPRTITAEIKARAAKNDSNIDPVAIWEQKYDIPAKREAKQKATYEADIAAAEARGREAGLSERTMPGPATPGRHAPIFRDSEGQFAPRTSRLNRPAPEAGVRSAAQAFATGKYRQPDNGARG